MSLFGSILSLQDAINRLPQFEYQINKLAREEPDSKEKGGSFRKNFVRQCQDLHKQLSDHRKRTENTKTTEVVKRENALEHIDQLKERLNRLCPEKETNTASTSGESEEEKMAKNGAGSRRKSMMYDGDESNDDSDNETEIIETDVHLEEPPQPAARQPIAVTRQQDAPKTTEVEKMVSQLQNPNRNETSELMDPVIVKGNVFMALADLEPETEGDLALRKGGKYRITQTRADGWWTALDEEGNRGLVPKTYLKHFKEKPKPVQSKVSSRLGVRDSVIGISTVSEPGRNGGGGERRTVRQKECLGSEFDHDPHLSLVCHLAPRLSTSNIGFHDLFWSHDKDQVYKRTVHVSKLVRLVRFEKMPLIQRKALVRMALVDIRNPKQTQVVSNVHTVVPRVKSGTWYFEKRESKTRSCIEYAEFVLRSNYVSPTVVLVLEASHLVETSSGYEEKSLGRTYLPIMEHEKPLTSKTNVLFLDNDLMSRIQIPDEKKKRILLQVMDVTKEKTALVDSLPDVIILNSLYLPFFNFYRRRAGTILIRDNKNPLSAEFVSDPLLAIFPFICDEHDVMDVMLQLWTAKKKLLAKKTESEQAAEFFQTFIHTAFFLFNVPICPYNVKDDDALMLRQKTIGPIVDALKRGSLREFAASQKFKPINILDYSLDLLGPHSID